MHLKGDIKVGTSIPHPLFILGWKPFSKIAEYNDYSKERDHYSDFEIIVGQGNSYKKKKKLCLDISGHKGHPQNQKKMT